MKTENEPIHTTMAARAMWILRILPFFHLPCAVNADQYLDFTYLPFDESVYISRYTGPGGVVAIPETINDLAVSSIGGWAFAGHTNVTSVTIPDSVNYIAVFAFSGCSGLADVTIPDSVTSLGNFAFDHCASLTNVTIPHSVTNLGDQVFSSCAKLADLTIPESVTAIGDQAFYHCAGLTNVTLLEGVASLGISAFAGCDRLTHIEVPNSLTNIGNWAFSDCANLVTITVATSNPAYSSLAGVLFNRSQDALVAYPGGKVGSYVIPDGVTSVRNYAFSDCAGLTRVTIPDSVTNFGFNAFSGCINLARVYFEGDAPPVGGKALFYNANNVTVYFRAGTGGWGATFAGRPTQAWTSPPLYGEWARSMGLLDLYSSASGETDDPDQDGANNLAEMDAGTDPTNLDSVLRFEPLPRPNDLSETDKTTLGAGQHALYFQSVPGTPYTIQSTEILGGGAWQNEVTVTATSTQKRVVLTHSASPRFYRVMLPP